MSISENTSDSVNDDLDRRWVELSNEVQNLASQIEKKTTGTSLSTIAEDLAEKASRLNDHIEHLHQELPKLLTQMETGIPLRGDGEEAAEARPESVSEDEVEEEKLQIQRESHEAQGNFKDVMKAMFMWVDDPKERIRDRE